MPELITNSPAEPTFSLNVNANVFIPNILNNIAMTFEHKSDDCQKFSSFNRISETRGTNRTMLRNSCATTTSDNNILKIPLGANLSSTINCSAEAYSILNDLRVRHSNRIIGDIISPITHEEGNDPDVLISLPFVTNESSHDNPSHSEKTYSVNHIGTHDTVNDLRIKNSNRILIGHININSIRNKFNILADLIKGKIDILVISETKIDKSFPTSQFFIPGFSTPYRMDRTENGENGGGILMYVREDIPSKALKSHTPSVNMESCFIEINLYKKKWLIVGTYNPCKTTIDNHLKCLSKYLDHYVSRYDNIILLGDFNCEPQEKVFSEFCDIHSLKNLVNVPTCFKNPLNPSCIDLILTNRPRSFQNTTVVETGLSDFHLLTITVLKTYFKKVPPKIISYRDYKNYSHYYFRKDLETNLPLHDICLMSNDEFVDKFMHTLEKHAPLKIKYVRANQSPFVTKELRKAFMTRSQLHNKYLNDVSDFNLTAYRKQRNFCTSLCRKSKKKYYSNLNPSCVSSNKKFWKSVKPLFSEKVFTGESITLIENDIIIDNEKKIADTFSDFFSNAVQNLSINANTGTNENELINRITTDDPVLRAIKKYETHSSILKIKECSTSETNFSFSHTTFEEVLNEIEIINISTAYPKESIPPNIIKEFRDIFSLKISKDFNASVDQAMFPTKLKLADIAPVHKSGNRADKSNYRPVSLLPTMSKIYERLLFHQIDKYINPKLSKYLCGFRKDFSAQHSLILLLEKCKLSLDKKGFCGALLTDLSKAFDCLDFDLFIAKLNAYGFSYNALKLIQNYLTNRFQRVKVNSFYSFWTEILSGVPQGSVLGPLLFNIYLNDLFFCLADSNIANYADDNTAFACKMDIDSVIVQLEHDSEGLLQWFSNNILKANADKFHLILSKSNTNLSVKVDKYIISSSSSKKLLGIIIDNKFTFNEHVSNLCKKASQKLHALARISNYMDIPKRRIIMKAFINSQFGYCPLVWMCHSRGLNNRINNIQERALRIVYSDKTSSFDDLLVKDGSVTVHARNIQLLATEIYKVINNLSPEIMNEVFQLKEYTNYSSRFPFKSHNVKTVFYGTETLSFLGPKIWSILPEALKRLSSLKEFKKQIKLWKPEKCPCRICKTFVAGVGFV